MCITGFKILVNRSEIYERNLDGLGPAQPIVADSSKPLDDIMRLFKREKYHLIYVMSGRGDLLAVVPEQRCDFFLFCIKWSALVCVNRKHQEEDAGWAMILYPFISSEIVLG